MKLDDKVLTINDKKYVVISHINYGNHDYVCLVNKDNEIDQIFREVNVNGDELELNLIKPSLFTENVFPLFVQDLENN